jgi:hypothetical protein
MENSPYKIMVITKKAASKKDESLHHLVYSDQLETLATKVYGTLKPFDIYGGTADELYDIGMLQAGMLEGEDLVTLEGDCKTRSECYIDDIHVFIIDMISKGELPAGRYHVRVRKNKWKMMT